MISIKTPIEHVIGIVSDLEIKIMKVKLDDSICYCKRDLFISSIRHLQHIVMLVASTKHVLRNESINEIVNKKLLYVDYSTNVTTFSEETSPVVRDFFKEVIEQFYRRIPILSERFLKIKNYNVFLKALHNRVLLLYRVLNTLFRVVYPVCGDFILNAQCSEVCKTQCVNYHMFRKTTVLLPSNRLSFFRLERKLYDVLIDVLQKYVIPSEVRYVVIDGVHIDRAIDMLESKNVSYVIITEDELPSELNLNEIKSCYFRGTLT